MYYVYALWSENFDKIYVGFSSRPEERLIEHNTGKAKWTKNFRPWIRFHLVEFESKSDALKHEKYLKSGWGRKGLLKILERWQNVSFATFRRSGVARA